MLALALLAAVVAACLPGGQMSGAQMPVGSRQLIITVTNDSPVPVPVEVAETGLGGTGGGTGQQVGRAHWVGVAQPASVPPGSHRVTFVVPPTNGWAIYANGGELIGPLDVGSHVGVLPIGIVVDRNGQPGWTSPGVWP
jgi:hypothetical protein